MLSLVRDHIIVGVGFAFLILLTAVCSRRSRGARQTIPIEDAEMEDLLLARIYAKGQQHENALGRSSSISSSDGPPQSSRTAEAEGRTTTRNSFSGLSVFWFLAFWFTAVAFFLADDGLASGQRPWKLKLAEALIRLHDARLALENVVEQLPPAQNVEGAAPKQDEPPLGEGAGPAVFSVPANDVVVVATTGGARAVDYVPQLVASYVLGNFRKEDGSCDEDDEDGRGRKMVISHIPKPGGAGGMPVPPLILQIQREQLVGSARGRRSATSSSLLAPSSSGGGEESVDAMVKLLTPDSQRLVGPLVRAGFVQIVPFYPLTGISKTTFKQKWDKHTQKMTLNYAAALRQCKSQLGVGGWCVILEDDAEVADNFVEKFRANVAEVLRDEQDVHHVALFATQYWDGWGPDAETLVLLAGFGGVAFVTALAALCGWEVLVSAQRGGNRRSRGAAGQRTHEPPLDEVAGARARWLCKSAVAFTLFTLFTVILVSKQNIKRTLLLARGRRGH